MKTKSNQMDKIFSFDSQVTFLMRIKDSVFPTRKFVSFWSFHLDRSSNFEIAIGFWNVYTQSPIIRTSRIRLDPEILGKFKTRALGSSNLRTTSKNLRTASTQIFKAKNQVLLPFLIHMYISFTCTYISLNFSLFLCFYSWV